MVLSIKLQNQIQYLHKDHPGNEWSGVIYWSSDSKDPHECTINVHDMLPINYAKGMAFDYEDLQEHAEDIYTYNPDFVKGLVNRGFIHTHVSTGVFFSGPDNEEITDSCKIFPFYVSLIVNNKWEAIARLCYNADVTNHIARVTNFVTKETKVTTKVEKDVLHYYDCKVLYETEEIQIDDVFKKKAEALKKKFKTPIVLPSKVTYPQTGMTIGKDPLKTIIKLPDDLQATLVEYKMYTKHKTKPALMMCDLFRLKQTTSLYSINYDVVDTIMEEIREAKQESIFQLRKDGKLKQAVDEALDLYFIHYDTIYEIRAKMSPQADPLLYTAYTCFFYHSIYHGMTEVDLGQPRDDVKNYYKEYLKKEMEKEINEFTKYNDAFPNQVGA